MVHVIWAKIVKKNSCVFDRCLTVPLNQPPLPSDCQAPMWNEERGGEFRKDLQRCRVCGAADKALEHRAKEYCSGVTGQEDKFENY